MDGASVTRTRLRAVVRQARDAGRQRRRPRFPHRPQRRPGRPRLALTSGTPASAVATGNRLGNAQLVHPDRSRRATAFLFWSSPRFGPVIRGFSLSPLSRRTLGEKLESRASALAEQNERASGIPRNERASPSQAVTKDVNVPLPSRAASSFAYPPES